ncbi:PREDICTED: sialidase-3-like [Thamnophis sirtalis]|uniref:exo-alpha-sialidase n=1 Tax=Thamnophis sirtalis TaxID=35019 RepID=A0A6I9Z1U6_9SAUR|nr:PREDICTED: sialidase-3-like [Thamnophis sirtalis]
MAETLGVSERVTLFRQERDVTYRIPALLYLPSESTFLAFAELRTSVEDQYAKELVMRRGQKEGLSVKWGPLQTLETAVLPKYRTMNPCPVYDAKESTIFLFFICVEANVSEQYQIRTGRNAAKLGYIFSKDGGRTWSPMTDLTEEVIGDDVSKWATFAVGPGHGVQLSSGRLVVPAYAYYIHSRLFRHPLYCYTKAHSFAFYSDDGGKTWLKGHLLQKPLKTSECQMAELVDQNISPLLYCNARGTEGYRVEAFSRDGGILFEVPFKSQKLTEINKGCQGSVVSFPSPQPGSESSLASSRTPESWLIFSHPTNRKERADLGIYLNPSPLEENSWKTPWILNTGPSGYSDLAVCTGEDPLLFGCLFECGVSVSYEEIAFQLFSDAKLQKTRNASSAEKN